MSHKDTTPAAETLTTIAWDWADLVRAQWRRRGCGWRYAEARSTNAYFWALANPSVAARAVAEDWTR